MTSDLVQLGYIFLALLLCAVIGVEREYRHKSAGMRTHALVGAGAALFMVVSKFGFTDVAYWGEIRLDPSRVASQIVSGIGFIGGGLIFVRRDAVRGLTTAAGIWVCAAVGSAAGAGMVLVATGATLAYLVVAFAFPVIAARVPQSRTTTALLRVHYTDGQGLLRDIIRRCTGHGYTIADLSVLRVLDQRDREGNGRGSVQVVLEVTGRSAVDSLVSQLGDLPGVLRVALEDGRSSE